MTDIYAPAFKTVLCAVDFSEHSRAALYMAAGLAFDRASRLVVLLVDDRASAGGREAMEAQVELQTFVRQALPGSAGYREGLLLIVRAGTPGPAILDVAVEVSADLIAVGTRGRGPVSRALFGSTTAMLLGESPVPVAIMPPAHPEIVSLGEERAAPHFGIILVPVDLATPATRQLEFAATLSPGSEHHLLLMHVVGEKDDREFARMRLNALAGGVHAARGWRLLVKAGTVPDGVLSVIHHEHVGIVVVGRSSERPGALAHELLAHGNAVLVMVPPTPVGAEAAASQPLEGYVLR